MCSVGDDLVLGELLGQVQVLLLLRGDSEVVAVAGHLALTRPLGLGCGLIPGGGGGGDVPDPGPVPAGQTVELLEQSVATQPSGF